LSVIPKHPICSTICFLPRVLRHFFTLHTVFEHHLFVMTHPLLSRCTNFLFLPYTHGAAIHGDPWFWSLAFFSTLSPADSSGIFLALQLERGGEFFYSLSSCIIFLCSLWAYLFTGSPYCNSSTGPATRNPHSS